MWVEDKWPAFICLSYICWLHLLCTVYIFLIICIYVIITCAPTLCCTLHFSSCLQPKKSLMDVDSLPGLHFSSPM